VASRVGDHFEFREPVDLDLDLTGGESLECVLELRVAYQQIELRDVDHNCRIYYCGMRAKLDGLIFQRVTPGKTLETQPAEPKEDAVLAIPGLPLKLRGGHSFSYDAAFSRTSRVIETYPFEFEEIFFGGNIMGPHIKHYFKWFRILDFPVNSLQISHSLPPGLVLSLIPGGALAEGGLRWKEATGRGFVEWSLIEKLPKFTMVGLRYYGTQRQSFKWQEKVYNCVDPEQTGPPGFRRVTLNGYCWFENTTDPDILPESY
jgi:hypothetical protein